MKIKTKRLAFLGLLTAMALILFVIELQIPPVCPIPWFKIGLANIITVYAVFRCSGREAFLVLISRVLLGAVLAGSAMTLIYSLCGAMSCFLGMIIIKRFSDEGNIIFCSIIGAALHNFGQTAAAVVIMGSKAPLAYFPFLLTAGCIAGAFTGITADIIIKKTEQK